MCLEPGGQPWETQFCNSQGYATLTPRPARTPRQVADGKGSTNNVLTVQPQPTPREEEALAVVRLEAALRAFAVKVGLKPAAA